MRFFSDVKNDTWLLTLWCFTFVVSVGATLVSNPSQWWKVALAVFIGDGGGQGECQIQRPDIIQRCFRQRASDRAQYHGRAGSAQAVACCIARGRKRINDVAGL